MDSDHRPGRWLLHPPVVFRIFADLACPYILKFNPGVGAGVTGGLEGLRPMDPGGAWLGTTLNNGHTSAGGARAPTLHAVTAEYEPITGHGLGRFVRDRLTDHVFKHAANDLVVPTAGVHAQNGAVGFPIDRNVLKRLEG
jgi:hypothetical protein